ncbi:hypothetical protein DPMN_037911 [Dreissena polymorpha]|uniref:Uncharacterized protein n=1 Tax=Dreissena polymorpha TaxID=45954 RepID=A0A9D4MEF9_DREPO|nr:hypothetical protein DPMN_037911 [Dreissena polymorpha]
MPYIILESFLKVVKVELTLVLHLLLNYDSAVKDLFYCAPPTSESSLLICLTCFGLTFQSDEEGEWHDFAV